MKKHIIINSDELQYYLKDLRKIPVITHERQEEIFKELDSKTITPLMKDKLLEELVLGNLRFVITIAKGYQNQGLDLMDLISEGNIGLVKGALRFDHTSGVKFISYAVWWIRQAIMASLNEYARTIRIPSNLVQELQKQKKKNKNEMEMFLDEAITLPTCVSLSADINDDGSLLIDILRDPNETSPEMLMNSKDEVRKRVDKILSVLDEREKVIIEKSFGLNGIESNLEDLGDEFNCTKERIRQLKEKAIKKLRNESYSLLNYL